MNDREKRIAEIREALEKATPRWHYNGNEIVSLDNPRVGIGGFLQDENNYLAANAPEWLRFLLSELERLECEYAEERAAHNAHVTELIEKEEECRKMRKELDILQELAVKVTVEREKERKSAQQETERLRQLYEREREIADRALEQVKNLREERNQDRQWIEKASENVTQLQKERDKLIWVLRWYADKTNYVQEVHHFRHGTLIGPAEAIYYDEGQRARDILHEIGVTGEC